MIQSRRIVAAGAVAVVAALAHLWPAGALNVPMMLDPTFGDGGKVLVDVAAGFGEGWHEDEPFHMVMQPDGKFVTSGKAWTGPATGFDFAVIRYNQDGSLDTTFAGDGIALVDFAGGHDEGLSLALQPDGKIVVAGMGRNPSTGSTDFVLARLNSDGTLDMSFGWYGRVLTEFTGGPDQVMSVIVQPDGRIVAGGWAWGRNQYDFALARYLPNGALDHSFGWGGRVMLDFHGGVDAIMKIAMQGEKIVAAGTAFNPATNSYDFALARFNSNGSLDTTFGNQPGKPGVSLTDFFGGTDIGMALLVLPDGKILVGGLAWSTVTGNYDLALAQYHPDGALDLDFAVDGAPGILAYDVWGHYDQILALTLQPDGKIVAAGHAFHPERHFDFLVARFNRDGTPDDTFGVRGLYTVDFFGGPDGLHGVVTTDDGRIIAAGDAENPATGGDDFATIAILAADPSWIRGVMSDAPESAFASGGRAEMLAYLSQIEIEMQAINISGAIATAQVILSHLDGCGAAPDPDDWVVDCALQLQLRKLVEQIIFKLGG